MSSIVKPTLGFTIIELPIVIISYGGIQARAKDAVRKTDLHAI